MVDEVHHGCKHKPEESHEYVSRYLETVPGCLVAVGAVCQSQEQCREATAKHQHHRHEDQTADIRGATLIAHCEVKGMYGVEKIKFGPHQRMIRRLKTMSI